MQCDMCGKDAELYQVKIEGTEMKVCSSCSGYGKIIRKVVVKKVEPRKPKVKEPEVQEIVVKNYSDIVRNARERKGLKQEELSKILNLKTSLLQNMERGKYKPSVEMAKKLEKELHVKLIEVLKNEVFVQQTGKDSSFTLGDFIKKK